MTRPAFFPLSAFALAWAAACSPTLEDSRAEGGQAPNPTAVLRGTLTYSGPAPTCDDAGQVQGLALLTLFSTDAPPPPVSDGLPVNLLLIRGTELFRAGDDCRRVGDPTRIITRTTPFTWPNVPLDGAGGEGATYFVAATWDDDRDLNPLFRVRSSPTQGDLLGGLLDDPRLGPQQTIVSVGPAASFPDGQVVEGLNVVFGISVNTEVPVAHLDLDRLTPLDSAAIMPAVDLFRPDRAAFEGELLDLTQAFLQLPNVATGPYAAALATAGFGVATDPVARAWYVNALDTDGDGPDLHPVLGSALGPANLIPWLTPVVIFARARTPAEVAARIPSVAFFGHVVADRSVLADSVPIAIPPIAIVRLDPSNPACSVAYVPPGNATLVYELAPASACAELPTGAYDVSIAHGVAGAATTTAAPSLSETGFALAGGQFSGQFWLIPNELGPPDTAYNPTAVNQLDPPGATDTLTIAEQGPEGRLYVVDSAPGEASSCTEAFDPLAMTVRPIVFPELTAPCCAAVAHLCGLALCPAVRVEGQGNTRELTGPVGNPTCVPFPMPPACCPTP